MGREQDLEVAIVGNHEDAKQTVCRFLSTLDRDALIVTGGGAGTLRAVIEACFERDRQTRSRVQFAPLRLGSGNELAKALGAPADPLVAIARLAGNLRSGRTVGVSVIRVLVGGKVHYGATLVGLGQFGRVPRILESLHRRFGLLFRVGARFLGIERLTRLEYHLVLAANSVACLCNPARMERLEVRANGAVKTFRLWAGAVLNFPLRGLPLETAARLENPSASLHLAPFRGRLALLRTLADLLRGKGLVSLELQLREGERAEIKLLDRSTTEFFVDEDPLQMDGQLTLEMAGQLSFVRGTGNGGAG